MKVVIKKEICKSREQCTELTRSALALLKRFSKKKKRKTQTLDSAFQHYPNAQLLYERKMTYFHLKIH